MISINPEVGPEPFAEEAVHGFPDLPTYIANVFHPDGWLVKEMGLEFRPQQAEMAGAVAGALLDDEGLLFEAGTGVGKSLAYLVPGILMAVRCKRPLVVSSHTIALQEQILRKDIPFCRKFFSKVPHLESFAGFGSALLVGKANYLCPNRLRAAIRAKAELFPTDEMAELQRIADWSESTEKGMRQELNPPPQPSVWTLVNADSSTCNRKQCNPEHCHYQKAKKAIQDADVLIVNHSLLFALMGAGAQPGGKTPGVLFPRDLVVLDEAHRVPAVATEHFGANISSYGLDFSLKLLFNPRRGRGFLTKVGSLKDCKLVEKAIEAGEYFFGHVQETYLEGKPVIRIREAPGGELDVLLPLFDLVQRLKILIDQQSSERLISELKDHRDRIQEYFQGIHKFWAMEDKGHVHWVEATGKRGSVIHLRTAPIDVAPYLRDHLFGRGTSVVMASATLSISGRMESFQKKAGAEGLSTGMQDSPFNFEANVRAFVAEDAPDVAGGGDKGALVPYFARNILHFATGIRGGTLVLFTSYREMDAVADKLEGKLEAGGRQLFVQGRDYARMEMLSRFQDTGNAILLGTDSFWTGVDVPGPSLSQVIVTRLPFENPTHPVAEARQEWISAKGGSPFFEMTVPDAVIQFRQGIGRLVRKWDDRGLLVLLDSRVLRKNYGKQFLDALPVPYFTFAGHALPDVAALGI
jgi:ATP-dependent DNA helicase DinG